MSHLVGRSRPVKALVLAPTAAPELVDLPDASGAELLAGLQAAVGGYIEPIITWDGARLCVNDEGRVRRMAYTASRPSWLTGSAGQGTVCSGQRW